MGRKEIEIPFHKLSAMYRRSTYVLGSEGASLVQLAKEYGGISHVTLQSRFLKYHDDLKADALSNPIPPETLKVERKVRKGKQNLERAAELIVEGYCQLNQGDRVPIQQAMGIVQAHVNKLLSKLPIASVSGVVIDDVSATLSPPSVRDAEVSRQNLTTPRRLAQKHLPDPATLPPMDAYALSLDTVTDDKIKENDPPRLSEGASLDDLLAFGADLSTKNALAGTSRSDLDAQWNNLPLELLLGEARDAENALIECAIQRWRNDTTVQDYQIERYERQLDALRDIWARIQALKAEQAEDSPAKSQPQPDPNPPTEAPKPIPRLHSLPTLGQRRDEAEEAA